MLVGYARVSTKEQNLDSQLKALQKIGCERIFSEKLSGKLDKRPQLEKALDYVREGDKFVVWKLDRLGRTARQLINLVEKLKEKGVLFVSITDCIDTSTAMGEAFFHIGSAFAQLEHSNIIERTNAGIKIAKENGVVFGRKRIMTEKMIETIRVLIKSGKTIKEISELLNISKATIYAYFPYRTICEIKSDD